MLQSLRRKTFSHTHTAIGSNGVKIILKTFCRLLYHFRFHPLKSIRETWFITRKIPNNIVFTAFLARKKAQSFPPPAPRQNWIRIWKKCPFNARDSNIFNQIRNWIERSRFRFGESGEKWEKLAVSTSLSSWREKVDIALDRCVWQIKMMKRFHYVRFEFDWVINSTDDSCINSSVYYQLARDRSAIDDTQPDKLLQHKLCWICTQYFTSVSLDAPGIRKLNWTSNNRCKRMALGYITSTKGRSFITIYYSNAST